MAGHHVLEALGRLGGKPLLLVECKWADAEADRSLRYLKARVASGTAWQISAAGRKDFVTPEQIRVCPAGVLLSTLA